MVLPPGSGWPMSSANKPSPKDPTGRAKKSAAKTTRPTSGSSKRSTASKPGANLLLAELAAALEEPRLVARFERLVRASSGD
jgi:hypothetical protein